MPEYFGVFIRPEQCATLNHKFQINDTATAVLQVKLPVTRLVQLGAHTLAHFRDFLAQFPRVTRTRQHTGANPFKLPHDFTATGNDTRTYQRLILPGPGAASLILCKGIQAAYQ